MPAFDGEGNMLPEDWGGGKKRKAVTLKFKEPTVKERGRPTVPEETRKDFIGHHFYLGITVHGGVYLAGEVTVKDLRWRYGKLDALVKGIYPSSGEGWVEAARLH